MMQAKTNVEHASRRRFTVALVSVTSAGLVLSCWHLMQSELVMQSCLMFQQYHHFCRLMALETVAVGQVQQTVRAPLMLKATAPTSGPSSLTQPQKRLQLLLAAASLQTAPRLRQTRLQATATTSMQTPERLTSRPGDPEASSARKLHKDSQVMAPSPLPMFTPLLAQALQVCFFVFGAFPALVSA